MGDSTLFNWKRGRIEIGDQFYDINNSSKLHSVKKVTLPPYSSNIIYCGLQESNFRYEHGYFTVNDTFRKDNLLLNCNQLGSIHKRVPLEYESPYVLILEIICGKKTCRAKEIVRDCTRQNQIEMYLKLMPSMKVMLKSEARDNCRNRRIQI
uniref:Uncharacterized protein n=1 Tax=Strongyloides venezuelensis TaxID=75913 RepID=A0A0K0FB85_STRVS